MKTVQITDAQHKALKLRAVQGGETIGQILHDIIDGYLRLHAGDAIAKPFADVKSVHATGTAKGQSPRPIPDLSKAAQVKGKMR